MNRSATLLLLPVIILLHLCLPIPAQSGEQDPQLLSLIDKMSLREKVSMVHGEKAADPDGVPYVGYNAGIERLSIPALRMQNGGSGAGASFTPKRDRKPATAFPVAAAQASTWNRELLYRLGQALGEETLAQGRDVLLAPMINIVRVPEGGRNFELFSEDPFLSARCTVAVTKGIQETGTMANAKVITANNQETWRHDYNAIVSERALREIYLPSFKAAVQEANVASVMTAFNKVNGTYCAEHPHLLRDILKNEWGFDGFVLTDWGTKHQAVSAANAGLDLEMSGWGKFGTPKFKPHLYDAVQNGKVKESTLNEMVYRILLKMKEFGHLNGQHEELSGQKNTDQHQKLARRVAMEGAVLLKNDGPVLPLNEENLSRIDLFGDAKTAVVTGGGSSKVVPPYKITPYEGLQNHLDEDTQVVHRTNPKSAPGGKVGLVYVSRRSSEGGDRDSIALAAESDLITSVSKKYDKTIVMLRTPGAYTMPWLDQADAVFQMWYPGLEEGNAEAALLFGDVNPSGKLPVTFGKKRSHFPASKKKQFPGVNQRVHYSEGIFVGYRYFDRKNHEPLFPFGHGLSYTSFRYGNLQFSTNETSGTLTVSYEVQNTGQRSGAEVSQLYIRDVASTVPRPEKELNGFRKVYLDPGEKQVVRHKINEDDLSYWHPDRDEWTVDPGRFRVLIGSSSRDLRLAQEFRYE